MKLSDGYWDKKLLFTRAFNYNIKSHSFSINYNYINVSVIFRFMDKYLDFSVFTGFLFKKIFIHFRLKKNKQILE